MGIVLRAESAADAGGVDTLTEAAFRDAAHSSHTEQFIVGALRRAGQLAISLVAHDGGQLAGHVAVSPVTISDGSAHWYGLGPISVAPGRQREGIGSQLVRQALSELRASGAAGCVVLGDPHYYGRFGFAPAAGLVLPGVPPQYFQAIAFTPVFPHGTVAYHDAFNPQA